MAASMQNVSIALSGQGTYNNGGAISNTIDSFTLGANGTLVTPPVGFSYGNGNVLDTSGNLQINDWHSAQYTITAGSTTSIDLYQNASYLNPFGAQLAFTSIRAVMIAILSPDGAKSVQVGPQAVANAAQLWFGGTGATAYETVYWWITKFGPIAGWSVTSGTADLLPIKNPGASSVTVNVWIAGVK